MQLEGGGGGQDSSDQNHVGPLFCRLGLQCSLFDKAYLPNVLLYLEPF